MQKMKILCSSQDFFVETGKLRKLKFYFKLI